MAQQLSSVSASAGQCIINTCACWLTCNVGHRQVWKETCGLGAQRILGLAKEHTGLPAAAEDKGGLCFICGFGWHVWPHRPVVQHSAAAHQHWQASAQLDTSAQQQMQDRYTYRQGVDEKLLLNVDSLCDDLCQPVGLQGVLQQPAADIAHLLAHSSQHI